MGGATIYELRWRIYGAHTIQRREEGYFAEVLRLSEGRRGWVCAPLFVLVLDSAQPPALAATATEASHF